MALNDVKFVRGQGGLGRPANGEDYISGMMFLTDNLPSGFDSANRVKLVQSVEDAENLGIVGDYSDETQATATVEIDTNGSTGDKCIITVLEPLGAVELCEYTVGATETTGALQAAALATAINNNTYRHGYVATYTSGVTFTLTARKGLGIYLNGNNYWTLTNTGTLVVLGAADFASGTVSEKAIFHYHIAEYFRLNPTGSLWVGFYALTGNAYDFAELISMQDAADGKIRQFYTYVANTGDFDATAIQSGALAIQAQLDALEAAHYPCSAILEVNIAGIASMNTVPDLATSTCRGVSVSLAQDGLSKDGTKAGLGWQLFRAAGYSIGCGGAILGAASAAKVSESIAWVDKFNMTNGIELMYPAFANGQTINRITDKNLLDTLNSRRYIFTIYYPNRTGSYLNDNHCAITFSSDYAYMNDNRTMDKVHRVSYAAMLPNLSGPLTLNQDGTLANTTVAYLESQIDDQLDQMVRDGEISGKAVVINPAQNVLATSKVVVSVTLLPQGVSRNIEVNAKYTTAL